jgi:hypothetical protein
MARIVFVIGETGTGKTRSLLNMNEKTTVLINCVGKDLPFRKGSSRWNTEHKNYIETTNPATIIKSLDTINKKRPEITDIVIDDFQYVMSFEYLSQLNADIWEVFRNIGGNVHKIMSTIRGMRKELTVFILSHSDTYMSEGFRKSKIKTVGKMTDEKITLEGLATVVIYTGVDPNPAEGTQEYFFVTQNDGSTTAKSPEGMFESVIIPNDLKLVSDAIRDYF